MPEAAIAAFARQFGRFRRRMAMVVFVRYGLAAAATALVGAQGIAIFVQPSLNGALRWFVAGSVVAFIASAVAALAQTRPSRSIAIALDRRLGLEDRVLSAVQFSGQGDEVSRLVVADAAARMAALGPGAVPWQAPPGGLWLLGAVLCSSMALGVRVMGTSADQSPAAAGGIVIPGGRPSASASANPSVRSPGGVPSETVRASGNPVRSSPVAGGAPEASGAAGIAAAQPSSPADQARPAEQTGDDSASVARDNAGIRVPSTGERRASSASGGDGQSGRGGTQPTAGGGRNGLGGNTPGAPDPSGRGGAQGGALTSVGGHEVLPRNPDAGSYDMRYRAAVAHAEAAIAQQRVPPRLRAYVRDYFVGIRSAGAP